MPTPLPSDLSRELLHAHAGLLVALEALRRARESLHDHVCDAGGGCSLCLLRRSLTVATARAARVYDAVEESSAPFVDQDALDVTLVDVQEMLDGERPLHVAGTGCLRSGWAGINGGCGPPLR